MKSNGPYPHIKSIENDWNLTFSLFEYDALKDKTLKLKTFQDRNDNLIFQLSIGSRGPFGLHLDKVWDAWSKTGSSHYYIRMFCPCLDYGINLLRNQSYSTYLPWYCPPERSGPSSCICWSLNKRPEVDQRQPTVYHVEYSLVTFTQKQFRGGSKWESSLFPRRGWTTREFEILPVAREDGFWIESGHAAL